jgi:hypothetical protein
MEFNILTQRISKLAALGAGLGIGFGLVTAVTGTALGGRLNVREETYGRTHKITAPVIDFNAYTPCAQEIAAYASAVVNLRAAQEAADELYDEWAQCEMEQGEDDRGAGLAETERSAATQSVLER